MPYTYDRSPSGDTLNITRCDEDHVQLIVQSGIGHATVPVCIAPADLPEVIEEMLGWSLAGTPGATVTEKIVKCSEVREGDEVLVNGRMETVTALGPLGGPWTEGRASLFLGGTWYTPRRDQLTAVRRYQAED